MAYDVWRVPGQPAPLIVKTPPEEGEGCDPAGLLFAARSLDVLGPTGALADVSSPEVRPPRLVDFDDDALVLVEEDAGDHADLGTWLTEGRPVQRVGQRLGRFIGTLHAESRRQEALAALFENPAFAGRPGTGGYEPLAERCRAAGLEQAGEVLSYLDTTVLVEPEAECLVVGNLRPSGVLVLPHGLRLVDWAAAHFGSPAEDVGYLSAHLWMRIHRAPSVHAAVQASLVLRDFLEAYAAALVTHPGQGFSEADVQACALYFGTTLLRSAVATQQGDSLYVTLPIESPIVQEAVAIAVRHLRYPADVDMFSILRPTD